MPRAQYDLEERTETFARNCRQLLKSVRRTHGNIEDGKQLIRSSGSVAANYIEANEAISKKDFRHRIKICRKESKKPGLWLRLLDVEEDSDNDNRRKAMNQEALELTKIFGAILHSSE